MSSSSSPNLWSPYETYKDCSQGICSIYCPQWCYIIFPPPPPDAADDDSFADFSPILIALIGILASAFIIVTNYAFFSRYCKRRDSSANFELDRRSEPAGLDESQIKTIAVHRYSKNDGVVDGADCSVCLSEFREDESLRLLPKCNHAFHLPCIDAWLRNHASCPLCRSDIATIQIPQNHQPNDAVLEIPDLETAAAVVDEAERSGNRAAALRRSVSLDSVAARRETAVRISDILEASDDDDEENSNSNPNSKSGDGGGGGSRVLNLVAMKRSTSTGRFMFSRNGRGSSIHA